MDFRDRIEYFGFNVSTLMKIGTVQKRDILDDIVYFKR